MSVFNSSTNGGSGGGGFSLGSGAATGTYAAGSAGGLAAQAGWFVVAWTLFAVMAAFTCVMAYQAGMRLHRRRRGAR